jgi:hypothetical protein
MAERWPVHQLQYTGHALRQMFARRISTDQVRTVLHKGSVVADYPNDRPYPSRLLLGFDEDRPLHVVFAYDEITATGYVITAYEPSPELWEADFMTRRTP